jgi:hypothetical protein
MSEPEKELQLEGITQVSRPIPGSVGKPFCGVIIKCDDDKEWVVSYDEQSPFHAFADRRVVVSGEPFEPKKGQYLVSGRGPRKLGHFKVSTLRLFEVTSDAELVAVGPDHRLNGRFERDERDTKGTGLSFVTDSGETFLVANDPPGANVGGKVEVWAHPVQRPPSIPVNPGKCLWIRCRCSAKDVSDHRERSRLIGFARDGSYGPMDEALLREFQRFIRAAAPGNFLRLRETAATSSSYEPDGGKPADADEFLARGNFSQAGATLRAFMPNYLLNPGIHTRMASVRNGLSDRTGAWAESDLAKRCIAGIRSTGAGSRERPYLVLHSDDEYDILESYSKKSSGQTLFLNASQAYHRHDCEDGDPVWFDVTISYTILTRRLEKRS